MKLLKSLFAAFGFLTVLPIPAAWRDSADDLGRSAPFFALVGLAAGVFAAAVDLATGKILPSLPSAVLTAAALLAVSGALHLDGLADTADGFFSSRPRERILEIMRDSRIGTMGVAAIVIVLLLKVSALAALPGESRFSVILLMPLAGRVAPVLMMASAPYARADGLGAVFGKRRLWAGATVCLAALFGCGYVFLGAAGLAAAAATVVITMVFTLYCRAKIGGWTGDTAGAACELAELVPALAALAAMELI